MAILKNFTLKMSFLVAFFFFVASAMWIESEAKQTIITTACPSTTHCFPDYPSSCTSVADCRNCCVCNKIIQGVFIIPNCNEKHTCECVTIIPSPPPPPIAN
ncbi:hypothetical protein P8452_19076 [Trifolium repens]|nr:hypothetical protein P8452_19076 [Trifolium repens]